MKSSLAMDQTYLIHKIVHFVFLIVVCLIGLTISNKVQADTFSRIKSSTFGDRIFRVEVLKNNQYGFVSVTENNKAKIIVLVRKNNKWEEYYSLFLKASAAFGIALTPDESMLAVTLDNKIAVINVKALLKKQNSGTYVNVATSAADDTGAMSVVAATDNQHFFIANEYSRTKGVSGIGNVTIVSAKIQNSGAVQAQRLGYIKTGQSAIPSISLSPNGKTLYIMNQIASQKVRNTFSGRNPDIYKKCSKKTFNGAMSVVDTNMALTLAHQNIGNGNRQIKGRGLILANISTGCGSVRSGSSPDGKTLWVANRGLNNVKENKILVYDAVSLRNNPNNAYLYSFSSNGQAPIGISTFGPNGRYLAVSNSNRFNVKKKNGGLIKPNISIFDVSNRNKAKQIKTITLEKNSFPRDISTNSNTPNFVYIVSYSKGFFNQIKVGN